MRLLVTAAAEAQQDGVEPTNAALRERGGPQPDATDRLLERALLTGLAATQSRMAIDAELVPEPDHLIAEAYTQRTMGPEKYGTAHIHRPRAWSLTSRGRARATSRAGSPP